MRIKDYPITSNITASDYLLIDNLTYGVRTTSVNNIYSAVLNKMPTWTQSTTKPSYSYTEVGIVRLTANDLKMGTDRLGVITGNMLKSFMEEYGALTDGTVKKIVAGKGLIGGVITEEGTLSADLLSDAASTLASNTITAVTNRQYAVGLDANGHLSVNVPWTDTHTTYSNMSAATIETGSSTTGELISAKVVNDWYNGKLKSGSSKSTLSSVTITTTTGRQYAVEYDKDGKLSVNVPWTDTHSTYDILTTAELNTGTDTNGKLASAKAVSDYYNGKLKTTTKGTLEALSSGNTENREYAVHYDKNGVLSVNVPWIRGEAGPDGTVTQIDSGIGLTGGPITVTGSLKVNLANETASSLEAPTTYSTTANREYAVHIDKNGKLAVNVPWAGASYTNMSSTTITTGTSTTGELISAKVVNDWYNNKLKNGSTKSTLSSAATTSTAGREYAVEYDKDGKLSVNVPWTDTQSSYTTMSSTTITTGTSTTGELISAKVVNDWYNGKIMNTTLSTLASATTYTKTSNREYAVHYDKNGKLAVNVPWVNTNTTDLTPYLRDGGITETITQLPAVSATQYPLRFYPIVFDTNNKLSVVVPPSPTMDTTDISGMSTTISTVTGGVLSSAMNGIYQRFRHFTCSSSSSSSNKTLIIDTKETSPNGKFEIGDIFSVTFTYTNTYLGPSFTYTYRSSSTGTSSHTLYVMDSPNAHISIDNNWVGGLAGSTIYYVVLANNYTIPIYSYEDGITYGTSATKTWSRWRMDQTGNTSIYNLLSAKRAEYLIGNSRCVTGTLSSSSRAIGIPPLQQIQHGIANGAYPIFDCYEIIVYVYATQCIWHYYAYFTYGSSNVPDGALTTLKESSVAALTLKTSGGSYSAGTLHWEYQITMPSGYDGFQYFAALINRTAPYKFADWKG